MWDEFIADLRSRVPGSPQISSDGFEPYVGAIASVFGRACHYGQIVKSYKGEPPITAARRYGQPRRCPLLGAISASVAPGSRHHAALE